MSTMLKHKSICDLIPHTGDMCLLDSVERWDEDKILCISQTHRNMHNPLRNDNGLPMLSLIEYGAQAMAVHARLLAEVDSLTTVEGYLAALRDIQVAQGWLSDIESALEIHAERIYSDAGNMIYLMNIHSSGKLLASGRATVVAKFSE